MASLDPKAFAHLDLYAILGVDALSESKDIESAWRKFALKHHPDRVAKEEGDTLSSRFHQGRTAIDILSDPALKKLYDDARAAREVKSQIRADMSDKRKKLVEDLERRERIGKRRHQGLGPDFDGPEYDGLDFNETMAKKETGEKLEIERITGINKQVIEHYTAKIGGQRLAERQRLQEEKVRGLESFPDIERSILAHFKDKKVTQSLDGSGIRNLFSVFGPIETATMLKDKKCRLPGSKTLINARSCGIIFKSIVGAYSAVNEWEDKKQVDGVWKEFVDVKWGGQREPACIAKVGNGEQLMIDEERAIIKQKLALKKGRASK